MKFESANVKESDHNMGWDALGEMADAAPQTTWDDVAEMTQDGWSTEQDGASLEQSAPSEEMKLLLQYEEIMAQSEFDTDHALEVAGLMVIRAEDVQDLALAMELKQKATNLFAMVDRLNEK